MPTHERACRLRVRGLVQGVGFRPFVYRLATSLNLRGYVYNDGDGVLIHVQGITEAVDEFCTRMRASPPVAARVESMVEEPAVRDLWTDFHIHFEWAPSPSMQTRVPPDRAICRDCRNEILDPANRRYRHPFATCTECGPRYSILERLPYERHNTAMTVFGMCRACSAEYANRGDRRFHAEPIACPQCGPQVSIVDITLRVMNGPDWPAAAAKILRAGKILALKGLGGYQLLVRADDDDAVLRLRQRKHRPTKPFAVMVASIEQAEKLAHLSPRERELLLSAENPIVILGDVIPGVRSTSPLGLGLFLATTPLHVALLSACDFPVVATSGNQSEEPIVIDENQRESLASIADAYLEHDRRIVRRVDDSVVRVIDEQPMMLRLARGYAPFALTALERWAAEQIPIPPMLAVGGQQKTTLALWTGRQAILSAHIGDMDHPAARQALVDAVGDLVRLYGCDPLILVGDLHPDYFTTRWAQSSGKPFWQVQHHHAHAVACMAEHGLMDRDATAVIWDGTGYGPDGTIWGGEILHVSAHDFQRAASLDPFPLPGGEAAIREPGRIALAMLADIHSPAAIPDWLIDQLGFTQEKARGLNQMIERQVNTPRTSSVGRLFDAVASIVLQIHDVSFEGEAALRLEHVVYPFDDTAYPLPMHTDVDGLKRGDWRPLIDRIVFDLGCGIKNANCAARFHNSLAQWAADAVASSPHPDVLLGGGCFQNAWLTRRTRAAIVKLGKSVHVPSHVPPNDGGLAVGQLAIGMARWLRQAKEKK